VGLKDVSLNIIEPAVVHAPCSMLQGIFDPQGCMFILIAR